MAPEAPKSTSTEFVQGPIDYQITGTRHWSDLSGQEQDDHIRACFEGEASRAILEERLQLLDRIAATIADNLLGLFRQVDTNGRAHYQPESPARVDRVVQLRAMALTGTPLGRRLVAARRRWRKGPYDLTAYATDPQLQFQFLDFRETRGLEILAEESFGGRFDDVSLPKAEWNDWNMLERQQQRQVQREFHRRLHRTRPLPPEPTPARSATPTD